MATCTFGLVFLFGYSPLSLLFLFISWLILTGITLHLFFLATSEDDAQFKFSQSQNFKAAQQASAKPKPLEDRDEFIAPRTVLRILLSLYSMLLSIMLQYKNLERARNPKHTLRFLCCLPIAIVLIYGFGISDAFVGWIFVNYIVLLPFWPVLKSSLKVPKAVRDGLESVKTLLVPRFLRSRIFLGGDKQKSD